MDEDRKKDQLTKLVPTPGNGGRPVSLEVLKSAFIAEGLGAEALAERYGLAKDHVLRIIEQHKLHDLRQAYVREGISKIQNKQISQAQALLDLENNFKKLRIVQLEHRLNDYLAYYARHGDFCKRHPVTGEILKDLDGFTLQIPVPSVVKEIEQLKSAVTMSEGLKQVLLQIDDIINRPPKRLVASADNVIDVEAVDALFKPRGSDGSQ